MKPQKFKFQQKYQQFSRIGQGKMGVVYKVQKRITGQSQIRSSKNSSQQPQYYAAKHISLNKIDIDIAKKQLKILEQLKHMYIVRYYEDFVENEELILIMDYCEGKDLEYHIQQMKKKGKYFNESVVSTWIFQLILVVQYIHSCNIIHRDIKPQNIFVDKDMNLKIGDFGVSKLLDGTQNCQTVIGTPFYFSPQLSKNEDYTKKTDIWSLGCVIYEICTLQKPFNAKKGFIQLCNVIQTQQPKNIPSIYSPDLNKLIKKMLTKDPKKRPTSRQLLQDPILVQLMINYSSQINLKQQYEKKPLQKPTLTDSFIEVQSNALNERMIKFQQEIKQKMNSLKNKKVRSIQIDNYYAQVQDKMKNLQKVVDTAFRELKSKSQPINSSNNEKIPNTKVLEAKKLDLSNLSNSSLSESDDTIQSINLKSGKFETQKQLQEKILAFNQSSSIDSVNSVLLESKKSLGKSMNSSLGASSKLKDSSKIEQGRTSKLNMTKKQYTGEFEATLKSQFVNTIQKSQNPSEIKATTINHLDQVSKQILSNPNLLLDDTFLDMTLSISNKQAVQLMANKGLKKMKGGDAALSLGTSYSSSANTINFDFSKSKKDYEDSINGLPLSSRKAISEHIVVSDKILSQKDSLEQQYEPDFESYEEDKQMDVRQQEKKSVKQLFSSTLKNFSLNQSNSNNSSYSNPSLNPRNKYSLTLSTIKQQSNEGGSTINYQDDFQ